MRVKLPGRLRSEFFSKIKDNFNGMWKDFIIKYGISKANFYKYKNGRLLMPEELFLKFNDILDDNNKSKFLSGQEKLPNNFGQIKGGKSAYIINREKFAQGRKKGLTSMHKYRRTKLKIEKISFDSLLLSTNLCELAGTFIGDGCFNLYKNKVYHIEFAGDKRYDLPYYNNVIIPIIKEVIPDIKPHFYKSYLRENAIRIVFYSRSLFFLLKDFLGFIPGKKTFTVKIPDKIIGAGSKYILATIRGIFDTDGGVFIDRRAIYKRFYPRIIFQTVSKPLYEQLIDYLSSEFKIYTRFNEKRQIYIIEIYGINQVNHWMEIIGFSNKRHLDRLSPAYLPG